MSPHDESERLQAVARLYAEFLERRKRGEGLGLEEFCAAHPGQAEALKRLDAQWEQWKTVFEVLSSSQGEPASKRLAEELRERFGEVDPGVSLGGEKPQEDTGPSSELLKRLRMHAPENTRYRLLGEVGRGGMGAVIRVWDEDLRRTLAMKVVLGREDKAGKGPTPPVDSRTLGRFLEEAQVTGQLDHPGIVPVHELGLGSDGQVYFTMRLVKGEDLKQVFAHVESGHDGWNTTRALGVMLKVCEAMAYAHSKGVIHRDLKPANIMVGRYGEVYVMDWGLARVLGRKDLHDVRLQDAPATSQSIQTERREERADTPDSPLVTMDGDVVGTPAYMSPEQAMGKVKELGPASDVYAVGAMLYHLLAVRELEMPYVPKGARVSARSVHMAVVQGAPKPLAELAPNAPAELLAIIEKAMSRDAATRYRDMEALAADLRAYIEGRVVSAYETGSWAEAKKWVQRNKPLTAAAAAAVLALLGGIAFSWNFALAADAERGRTERANTALNEKVAELKAQSREQQLRGLAQELARFRAQRRTTDGLDRLGKPAWQWWLDEADRLLDGREEDLARGIEWSPGRKDVQAKLAELRVRALPWSDADKAKDIAAHPAQRKIRQLEQERDERLEELRDGADESAAASLEATLEKTRAVFEARIAPLRAEAFGTPRATWRFERSEDEWWHAQLTELETELAWLESMRTAAHESNRSERAQRLWAEAIEGISRAPKYAGQRWPSGERLTPQAGLLPLGENPATGLWEFVHLQSGSEPMLGADGRVQRSPEGHLTLTPETGMVLVLLPGGRVPKADSDEQEQEDWITSLELAPFFLSKYELTAEQWDRLSLRRGYSYTGGNSLTPANMISWDDITLMWPRELGWCDFPSEMQWEYGCRAGTTSTWWTGEDKAVLSSAANLGDDIASIGGLRANAFGLHDVHGNVREWCGDTYNANAKVRVGDGLRDDGVDSSPYRSNRGGGWYDALVSAGSAARLHGAPVNRVRDFGLRPSRRITP